VGVEDVGGVKLEGMGAVIAKLFCALTILTATSCAPAAVERVQIKPQISAEEQAKYDEAENLAARHDANDEEKREKARRCVQIGGKYDRIARFDPIFGCALTRPDAGKICEGNLQCTGECLAPERNAKPGEKIKGRCEASFRPTLGCIGRVENSRVTEILCVD
jgi:hypothetical protein